MKRKIFTLAFSVVAMVATAQTPGVTATSIYDDVAQTAMYDNGADDPLTCDWSDLASTACGSGNISSSYVRNTTTKKMEYTLNVPGGGCWDPAIWVGFTASTATPGINISAHKSFSVVFTNSGNTTIDVYIDLVDSTKKVINVDAGGTPLAYKSIGAGQTVTIDLDLTGAYYFVDPQTYTGFDFTKVIGMDISIFNSAVDGNWDPLALPANYKVALSEFKLGVGNGASVNDLEGNTIAIFPNPARGHEVSFSQPLTNIKVYNAIGELIMSEPQATKINVSSLQQGIYMLTSTQGISKIVVE